MAHNDNLYIVHLSIHGLIRGTGLELGRDADTGGQCKYVLELVKALGRHPRVGRVDLFTRSIIDPRVSEEYGQPLEDLGHGAFIRRIEAGPRRYLRKESLWRYLDAFLDKSLMLFRETGRLPDLIHAHYADAGYIGSRLSTLLGCPFVFTGHSLGRTKRQRLLDSGADSQASEKRYNLSSRIEAEELALDVASRVVTSTQQEVEQQYSGYEFYDPDRMRVIPPGVDVSRFSPPGSSPVPAHITEQCDRFLDAPAKPAILTIARADEKKNLATLVRAYGESATLREQANLILIAGNRSRIRDLNPGARKVWTELLQLVDDYDLYGHIAIPKHHQPDDIPAYYRHAAASGGVFVNPAWTEPFGLTLIEAAASGLPILATNDGGPRDIIANCENGVLIDPADVPALTATLERVFGRPDEIARWSENGIAGVDRHYTWEGHVARYLEEVGELVDQISQPNLITEKFRTSLPLADRLIVSGLEERLESGDAEAIAETARIVRDNTPQLGFAIASGRSLGAARQLVEELGLPRPTSSSPSWARRSTTAPASSKTPRGPGILPTAGNPTRFSKSSPNYPASNCRRRKGVSISSRFPTTTTRTPHLPGGRCRNSCARAAFPRRFSCRRGAFSMSSRSGRERARPSATWRFAGGFPSAAFSSTPDVAAITRRSPATSSPSWVPITLPS